MTDAKRAKLKQLFEAGKTDREMAAALGIAESTVSLHKKKLGLTKQK